MSRNASLSCQSWNNTRIIRFAYVGWGYHYLSGKGILARRLDKIQNSHAPPDRNDEVEILMMNYKVADVRFYHELFAPHSLSVFGWRWH
jgi:hypothetical protein